MRLLLSNCKSVIVLSPGWNYAPSPSPPFQPLVPESFWNSLSIQVIKVNPRGREREREKEFFSQWEKRGKLIGRHARSNLIVNCFGNKSRTNIEGGECEVNKNPGGEINFNEREKIRNFEDFKCGVSIEMIYNIKKSL